MTATSAGSRLPVKQCRDCRQVLPTTAFYFVNKSAGTLRGQCKPCMMIRKAEQRDPNWRPSCARCSTVLTERFGSGTRLCDTCFDETYERDHERPRGSHRIKLKPCSLCGGEKERFERGKMCTACKPWANYAQNLRRFGLTPNEYLAILAAQGGVCYLCSTPPTVKRLSIDHDHALPEGRAAVRGLLCNDCNYSRLPRFNEDAAMLRVAVRYLDTPPARAILFPDEAPSRCHTRPMPDQPLPNDLVLDVASTLAEHGHDVFSRATELRDVLAGFLGSSDDAGKRAGLS